MPDSTAPAPVEICSGCGTRLGPEDHTLDVCRDLQQLAAERNAEWWED